MKKLFLFVLLLIVLPDSVLALCSTSSSCILMDSESKRILYEKNIDEEMLIASTTKLMTFLVAYENGNLDDEYRVGDEVLEMYGTSIYLSIDEKMSLKDLLYGLILRSGNDASVVISKNISDNFIDMMNEKALELGMNNTIFRNPHGLDEETENYSTSYDMALLISYLTTIPFYMEVASTRHYTTSTDLKSYDWYNRNQLLGKYSYTTSGKNGYTPKAGKTLVSSASKDNLNLVAVSLDDDNIYDTHIELYEYGFDNYVNYQIIDSDTFSYSDDNYNGTIYVENSFSYPVLESEKDGIRVIQEIYNDVDTSISNVVGSVKVYLSDEVIYQEELLIKVKEEKSGLWEKIVNWFKNVFGIL